ncbi:MAG: hypothetical protein BECKG1743D_GA0114223_104841 [Candidatus Kentron sp. G]|nr:MAG: hypothetical protein BECKG1743E_GA0114224_105111 [Candidatus Kentron sp. G]VFN03528.1 MAG: hypothetical protein BECKG1743D_GA0114223_104841 [Candidatus Kentron sp. G]
MTFAYKSMKRVFVFVLVLLSASLPAREIQSPLHHDIELALQPAQHTLAVTDLVTLPGPAENLTLTLHAGLKPRFFSDHGLVKVDKIQNEDDREQYRITLPNGTTRVRIEYAGTIHHALSASHAEQSRGFRATPGLIDAQGVFLAAGSLWYPQFDGYPYLTFDMRAKLPAGWSSVSQGRRVGQHDDNPVRDHWRVDKPQEEIYLIAAEFTEYRQSARLESGDVRTQVFLRAADRKLANKYLDAAATYLKMYEQLLGPYAYGKFALVENFWETGFGMPSFTLLGARVIRLPFILDSSYPHEILHNWWGNGVYVDYAGGNWSEGLTAYLADHLIKEQKGRAAGYRQQGLQKYRDYAANGRDFPLGRFKGRHSPSTEAVGYGKALMLFHMLRKRLGDETFIEALRHLYRAYRFRTASFDDVRQIFEQVSGASLEPFFRQWVERTGAPELVLKSALVDKVGERFRLRFTLEQVHSGVPYALDIPVAVSVDNQPQAKAFAVHMTARKQTFDLDLPVPATRVDIDPSFDLFRKLAMAETPPALTEAFGADDLLVVLPGRAQGDMKAAWRAFAARVSHMGPERAVTVTDDEIQSLPTDKAVMILGWNNRFAARLQRELARHPIHFGVEHVQVGQERTVKGNHAFAWVTRVDGTDGKSHARALIAADLAGALPGLARKIPHYHKYSYLAFAGQEPANRSCNVFPSQLLFSSSYPWLN